MVSVFNWMSTTEVAIPALIRGAERELEAGSLPSSQSLQAVFWANLADAVCLCFQENL